MRLSDFWERMDALLGTAYSRSWADDVVLPPLGLTVNQAIDQGVETQVIWRAVGSVIEVPSLLK